MILLCLKSQLSFTSCFTKKNWLQESLDGFECNQLDILHATPTEKKYTKWLKKGVISNFYHSSVKGMGMHDDQKSEKSIITSHEISDWDKGAKLLIN